VGAPLPNTMTDFSSIWRIVLQRDSRHSVAWRYGGAVLVSLAFIAVRWLVGHYVIDDGVPFATLFLPIALSAFFGGLGPGIVSVLITVSLADYFLIPPLYTLGLPNTNAVVGTLMFAVSGLIISALGEASREAVLQASNDAEIRKVAQQQLLANEERLRIAERVVSGGVWDWDIAKDNLYWSDGYQRICDFPLDERPSYQTWLESVHPDDRDRVVGQLDELFRSKLHNWSSEYRIRTSSGRIRWIESHGQVFYDLSGKPQRIVGINLDTTARRLTQEAAREAELGERTA
jgi:PAS domain-containing protein